jgi:GT2 family glycosyltransferase
MASINDLFRAGKFKDWWKFWSWKANNSINRYFFHIQNRMYGSQTQPWPMFTFPVRKENPELPLSKRFGFVILPGTTGGMTKLTHGALNYQTYPGWAAWNLTGSSFDITDTIKPGWGADGMVTNDLVGLKEFIQQAGLDYVSFLDEGDYFDETYLAHILLGMQGQTPLGVYCDEDYYPPPYGIVDTPFLKPEPSEALLLSVNYFRHAFVHKDLVNGLVDNQHSLFDLRERVAWELLKSDQQVLHLPGRLVHAAENIQLPRGALVQRAGVIQAVLEEKGLKKVEVEVNKAGQMHVTWQTSGDQVSIIVPTHEHGVVLKRMLDSLRQNTIYTNYEIILVDNHSQEEETLRLYDELEKDICIRVLRRSDEFNYSRYNNAGVSIARGTILLFLNNDVEITHPDWLDELVMWAERPEVGVVGARLMYPDGRIQHAGVVIGLVGSAGHVFIGEPPDIFTPHGSPLWYRNMLAVTGACMAMRREVYDELGGFDEAYQLTFSDITFSLKAIEYGYQVVYNPFACLVHHEGGTRGDHIPDSDIIHMVGELEPWIKKGDPFYNPRLSRMIATPTIRHGQEEDPVKRLKMIQELAEYPIPHQGRKS